MPQVERREPIISAHFKSHQHATVTPSHTHSNRGLFYAFKSFLTIIPDSNSWCLIAQYQQNTEFSVQYFAQGHATCRLEEPESDLSIGGWLTPEPFMVVHECTRKPWTTVKTPLMLSRHLFFQEKALLILARWWKPTTTGIGYPITPNWTIDG